MEDLLAQLPQQVLNGLTLGAIYALIALGYSMVYGVLQLLNFAHGDVFMIGSFVGFFILDAFVPQLRESFSLGMSIFVISLMLIASMGVCGFLGVIIEQFAYRPLRNAPRIAPLISALGVSFFIQNAVLLVLGGDRRNYARNFVIPPQFRVENGDFFMFGGVLVISAIVIGLLASGAYIGRKNNRLLNDASRLMGVLSISIAVAGALLMIAPFGGRMVLSASRIVAIASAILLMAVLWALVRRTRIGAAMRAVATDQEAAAMMGVDVDRVVMFTFFIGSALAGAAGVLNGLVLGQVYHFIGFNAGLKGFIAAVIGGIGNIPGAMLGGLLLGIVEAFAQGFISSTFQDVIVFLALIVVLLLRPSGLLGARIAQKV
ncbi:MAG: branched-chain amino acid ABC transporter permease [Chloroflexota bacterium]